MSGKDIMEPSNKISSIEKDLPKNPNKELEEMVNIYLASNPIRRIDRKINELEVRFGTNPKLSKPLSKIDYENVVKQLVNYDFKSTNSEGSQMLRIQTEYEDLKGPRGKKMSNIRAEIVGIDLIQDYCNTNSIQKLIDKSMLRYSDEYKVKFTKKSPPMHANNTMVTPVNFENFNFRVSYQLEQDFNPKSNVVKSIVDNWNDNKKLFRYINRVRYTHPVYPLHADISIIKGNKKTGKVPMPQYTIQEAGVFENIETYEVEFEIDNKRVGTGTPYNSVSTIIDMIKKGVRIILGALQGTSYPISYLERDQILQKYMKCIHGSEYNERRVIDRDFIGPSSVTLKMDNIIEESSGAISIRNNYTVTDKADGDRKLLYISDNGRIYMIDTNMNVIFTGTLTNEKTLHDTILDGEHIKYNKRGEYINLYAAFDIYYINKQNVRQLSFMKIVGEEDILDNKYRLYLLQKCMKLLKPTSIVDTGPKKQEEENPGAATENNRSCNFIIKSKDFYNSNDYTIFQGCNNILSKIKDNNYEYNTDGVIFTPCNTGVGGTTSGDAGPLHKFTWNHSFKWKPAEFNTIDFLVSVQKDKTGKDIIHNIFVDGVSTTSFNNLSQYKTLILRCGFDENKHGFINPFQMMIDGEIPELKDKNIDNNDTYKPAPFIPTNPNDPQACFCNIEVLKMGGGNVVMKTIESEYFEEDMIVEFKYDITKEAGWRWVPLRVRYDKTAKLRAGLREYGNPYHVSNDIWNSIHNPISEEMITSGLGIPKHVSDQDIYYNRTKDESNTKGLRNFHNLYVKKKLIMGVSNRNNTLIDFAVGKAGDLSKWSHAKLGFVFGIDISKDNIFNNLDGACSRYLKDKIKYNDTPDALFLVGNSSLNIRSGKAVPTDKDKAIVKAIFGNGPKDRKILGQGVYKHYGIAEQGFNISSCQFALHYFFESLSTLHHFIQNIAECTKLNGYFIGTCYDGQTVFNILKNKLQDESMCIMYRDTKIYEIVKLYNQTAFPDDENSIGFPINVFQESINKMFREYLVNFKYFSQLMEDYGLVIVTKEEALKMNMPNGTGMFNELFNDLENDVRRNPRIRDDYGNAMHMSPEEKRISFMNRYFIFKKVRSVNTEKVTKSILLKENELLYDSDTEANEDKDKEDVLKTGDKEKTKTLEISKNPVKIRKLKNTKLTLNDFSPIPDSIEPAPENIKMVIEELTDKPPVNEVIISDKKIKIPKNITKKNKITIDTGK